MALTRTLKLGRLGLVTVLDPFSETVGGEIAADDSGVAIARRRPRQFTLQLPVYGVDSDKYTAGNRLRRQLRAILENDPLRLAALYFNWSVDPEVNGWLVPGGGQITSQDVGGITFASWRLELDAALRIGTLRTHRPARRVELYDRTLATTPRDYRGLVTCTDWAALRGTGAGNPWKITGQPTFLPVGAANAVAAYRQPAGLLARAGIDGTGYFVIGLQHGNVVSFEHTEANQNKGDVVIWDRQGFTAPAYTLAGDTDPQDPTTGYGWEEVYGPDHPLTGADCVVLANGLCRVRWVAATSSYAVDTYVAATGYVEQGRVTVWDEYVAGTRTQHAYAIPQGQQGFLGTVLEWTPERAVIRVSTYELIGVQTLQIDTYITLQRGWLGPRFEAYCKYVSDPLAGCELRWTPNSAAAQTLTGSAGNVLTPWASVQPGPLWSSLAEPWVVQWPTGTSTAGVLATALVAIQSAARYPTYLDNAAYGGANRNSVAVAAHYGEAQVPNVYGYVSLHLAFPVSIAAGAYPAETAAAAGPRDLAGLALFDLLGVPTLTER